MGCGCKKRRQKIARAFSDAAKHLGTLGQKPTVVNAHKLQPKPKKSVGIGG